MRNGNGKCPSGQSPPHGGEAPSNVDFVINKMKRLLTDACALLSADRMHRPFSAAPAHTAPAAPKLVAAFTIINVNSSCLQISLTDGLMLLARVRGFNQVRGLMLQARVQVIQPGAP